MRAKRNRTLIVAENEMEELRSQLLLPQEMSDDTVFSDLIINADLMDVIDKIPDRSANLIIIDPPYNLSKIQLF